MFFYNPSSRISVWERPDDLVGRQDVEKMIANPPDAVAITKNPHQSDSSESSEEDQPTPAKKPKQEEVKGNLLVDNILQYEGLSSLQCILSHVNIYCIFVVAVIPKEEEEKEGKKTIDIGKEAAIEAEVRAARERAIVPLETRIKSFKDMLAEKDVSKIYKFFLVEVNDVIPFLPELIKYLSHLFSFRYLRSVPGRKSCIK